MAISMRTIRGAALLGAVALLGVHGSCALAQTRPASAADVDVPFSDARKIGPNSVRFAATQNSKNAPAILILGVTKANWPRLHAAIQQAVFDGSKVSGIFFGPQDAPPSLEIYAKGHQVSVNGINPNTITGPALTRLIKDVTGEYFR